MIEPLRLLLGCLLLCAAGHAQTTLYVDSSVSSSGTGSSWASAYKTLNEALITANAASTTIKYRINIAKGTYYPTGAQSGTNRDSTFLIARPGVALWGGYPSGGGTINVTANPTKLSGEIGSASSTSDNSYHVLVIANVTTSTDTIVLYGLNFSGGYANATTTYTYNSTLVQRGWGAGMYVGNNVTVKLLISSCNFSANNAIINGGAFANLGAEMGITSCTFSGNAASGTTGSGGAIYASGVAGTLDSIINCSFSNNTSAGTGTTSGGGAIYLTGNGYPYSSYVSNPAISNCSFTGNSAAKDGGALYSVTPASTGYGTLTSLCTFTNNTATGLGGGVYSAHSTGGAAMRRCTFTGNSAGSGGGAMSIVRFSSMTGSGDQIDSCSFTTNGATGTNANGGAVYDPSNTGYGSKYTACSFVNNSATGSGGGLYAVNGYTIVRRATFYNNRANASGGGIYFGPSFSSSTLDSSTFSNNRATSFGGGAYVTTSNGFTYAANVTVSRCQFLGDTAIAGGGGVASYGSVEHLYCGYFGNRGGLGGAMYLNPSANYITTVRHDTIQGNTATLNGGGMCVVGGPYSCSINNVLIAGNKAFGKGGAIFDSSTTPIIAYCTLAGDTALGTGNGIYNYGSAPTIMDCIVWEGPASIFNIVNSYPTVLYSIIGGGYPGNLSDDPKFVSPVSPSLAPTLSGNYTLSACSPAINAGNGTSSTISGLDLAGNARVYDGRTDMGAYEFQGSAPLTGPNPACTGSTAQYSNVTSGGTWSVTNTTLATISATGLLTPTAAGTDTIVYTVSSGTCAGKTYKPITISTSPSIPGITNSGSDSLCEASGAITLSNSASGGNWSSSNPTLASAGTYGYVTAGTGSGLDTIYYTYTSTSSGCSTTVSRVITVLPAPVIAHITGLDTVCQERTIQLSDATAGGTWMAPAINVSVSASGLVYGYVPGTGIIEYKVTGANGCSGKVTKNVTVLAEPTLYNIAGPTTACLKGGTFTLSELATGGAWHSLDPAIAVINAAGVVTPVAVGTARFSYLATNANGCSDSVTKSVTIHTIDNSVTQNGNVLTANYPSSSYYLWLNCDSNYAIVSGSGSSGQTFTATENGHYAVRVIGDGCADTSACFTVSGLAVKNPDAVAAVSVFPNPASGSFTLRTSGTMEHAAAYLCDITGRQLLRIPVTSQTTTMNVAGFSPGIYLIELRDGTRHWTQRLNIVR